jgi:hypothetical protein
MSTYLAKAERKYEDLNLYEQYRNSDLFLTLKKFLDETFGEHLFHIMINVYDRKTEVIIHLDSCSKFQFDFVSNYNKHYGDIILWTSRDDKWSVEIRDGVLYQNDTIIEVLSEALYCEFYEATERDVKTINSLKKNFGKVRSQREVREEV